MIVFKLIKKLALIILYVFDLSVLQIHLRDFVILYHTYILCAHRLAGRLLIGLQKMATQSHWLL